MKFPKLLILLLIISTYGCSSKYVVTYDSSPRGASLVCNGTNWGPTPKKLYYDESVKKQSSINVDCSANWISGAKKSYPSNLRIFPSGGTLVTAERPNTDGYAADAGYNLQLRQTIAAEKAAASAASAAAAAQNSNTTKSCKKVGDLSGRIYTFSGYCPFGYY
jgi:hypothetical protein